MDDKVRTHTRNGEALDDVVSAGCATYFLYSYVLGIAVFDGARQRGMKYFW